MAKVKSSKVPHYELLYIIPNNFSEDEVAPINDKVKKVITDNGGTITHFEEWGKKRFSYQIKTFFYGYYSLIEFDMTGENMAKANKALRMMSEVLRHQIVAKKIKTAEELERERKIAEKIASKAAKEEEAEKEVREKAKSKEKDKDKIELKDLDDKLDKILDTETLL